MATDDDLPRSAWPAAGDPAPADPAPADPAPGDPAPGDPAPGVAGRPGGRRLATAIIAAAVLSAGGAGAVVHAVDAAATPGGRVGTAQVALGGAPVSATTGTAQAALAAIAPAVVQISTVIGTGGGAFGAPTGSGAGSGIIVAADGTLVTNAHVVADASSITVAIPGHGSHPATVVGSDSARDLAVLRVSGVSGLAVATFADSSRVQVGDRVLAIGNAEGYGGQNTVTEGIISATDRTLPQDTGSAGHFLQTDAAINPGNSGGALVDTAGHVVGINSEVAASGGSQRQVQGIGLAIPSNAVTAALPNLEKGGSSNPTATGDRGGYLGVTLADTSDASGAGLQAVASDSPAARSGLRAGDVVRAVDGTPVASAAELADAIRSHPRGARVTLSVVRGEQHQQVPVTLGARPTTG